MILKEIPKDFIVNEIFDLDLLKQKDENNSKVYYYFILKKENYTTLKAIENVARIFNVSKKFINFAGNKDKIGVTTQIISIFALKKENLDKNLIFFNEKINDLNLEYLGEFKSRINLGDNLGNSFIITIRDLNLEETKIIKNNISNISKIGILNFFDKQRFGYANNSHIIGKFILKNQVELAVKEILTSAPPNPKKEHSEFISEISKNWDKIKNQDKSYIEKLIEEIPIFLRDEKNILKHLSKAKNDFPGAFRRIHKKIRTLYLNAYQSYIFNELIKFDKINQKYDEIELVNSDTDLTSEIGILINNLLNEDDLNLEDFKLKSIPELKLNKIFRKVKIYPKNFEIIEIQEDELNENKFKIIVKFDLGSGEYATNVVKQLLFLN